MSDTHLCHISWYGFTSQERMEKMVSDLLDEHSREPYDAILMLGDYSLDYWECGPRYGSFSNGGLSNTDTFLRQYVSRFPFPVYLIPGNHEQYTHGDWERITGGKRSFSVNVGDAVFVMLDNFAENLNPTEHSHGTYSYSDTNFIRETVVKNPGKRVFLCAHDFDLSSERGEFKKLVRETPEIIAMFAGHTHRSEIIPAGNEYGGKLLCRTGNYSYSGMRNPLDSMWGWRELVIDGGNISTSYVVPENKIFINENPVNIAYRRQDAAQLA